MLKKELHQYEACTHRSAPKINCNDIFAIINLNEIIAFQSLLFNFFILTILSFEISEYLFIKEL